VACHRTTSARSPARTTEAAARAAAGAVAEGWGVRGARAAAGAVDEGWTAGEAAGAVAEGWEAAGAVAGG
jgi:hypothetical protein